ncbi:Von Hippel-Lindau disease tumor suppressor, partial [Stegodyphus mimosarum]
MARVMSSIRSGPSRRSCFLRFVNKTGRCVSVIWMDYFGQEQSYGSLNPQQRCNINTYEGHPWICQDSVSKKRLLVNNEDVFYPRHHPGILYREEVAITIPVFELQELCAETINKNLSHKEDIRALNLPRKLQDMVLESYQIVSSDSVFPLRVLGAKAINEHLSENDIDDIRLHPRLQRIVLECR